MYIDFHCRLREKIRKALPPIVTDSPCGDISDQVTEDIIIALQEYFDEMDDEG